MSSTPKTAEERFREAFDRLRYRRTELLPAGSPVTQNNVAKEAGTDPTALRLSRYPKLIAEIKAYTLTATAEEATRRARQVEHRRGREDFKAHDVRLEAQRDHAQSELVSSHRILLELLQQVSMLESEIEELSPKPRQLRKS